MESDKPNVIDITGDGKLTKEILVEGHGESPKQNQTVEGNTFCFQHLLIPL